MTIPNRTWGHPAGWWERDLLGVVGGKAFSFQAAHPDSKLAGRWRSRGSREWGRGVLRAPAAPAGCSAAFPGAGRTSAAPRFASVLAWEDSTAGKPTRGRGERSSERSCCHWHSRLWLPAAPASPRRCQQGTWAPASLCAEGIRAERLKCRAAKHCCSGLAWGLFFPPCLL